MEIIRSETATFGAPQARAVDARIAAGETLGPLAGVPLAIKVCVCVGGGGGTKEEAWVQEGWVTMSTKGFGCAWCAGPRA